MEQQCKHKHKHKQQKRKRKQKRKQQKRKQKQQKQKRKAQAQAPQTTTPTAKTPATKSIFDQKAVTNIFKKSDKNGDLYLTTQELYDHYVENAKKSETKVQIDRVIKQQELIKKYAGDDHKLNIDEFSSLSKDKEYSTLSKFWGDFSFTTPSSKADKKP